MLVVNAFKEAIDRGVKAKLIIDAKVNERTYKKGVFHKSFPRTDNLEALTEAGIPISKSKEIIFLRESRKS